MHTVASSRPQSRPRGVRPFKWGALAVGLASLAMIANAQDQGLRSCKFSEEERDFRNCNFSGAELRGADFEGADLRGARLDWVRMDGANLQEANLDATDFKGNAPTLYRAHFKEGLLVGANFRNADVSYAHFDIADLSEANFENANLEGITVIAAYAQETNFRGTNLRFARFMESDVTGADFSGADLRLADFEHAIVDGINLEGAKIAGALSPAGFRCKGTETSFDECVLTRSNFDRYRILYFDE